MTLLLGDCLEQMRTLPDNSVDAVVTDPPYGLSFMNKKWDYDVPSVEIWREVYRVLKPGGHVLSFGGTRTYHRMVVNIEDAGFEIRDQVQWIYGSGFPKSHNVSKAIDKMAGVEREVVGTNPNHRKNELGEIHTTGTMCGEPHSGGGDITAPATPEAKTWDGWGSALKPANEPICLARKPLEKGLTLAENVLKWGTGAINIDGTRIGLNGEKPPTGSGKINDQTKNTYGDNWKGTGGNETSAHGRWPANILLDEDAAEMLDGQSGVGVSRKGSPRKAKCGFNPTGEKVYGKSEGIQVLTEYADSGGASRFFYVAKASKRERNAGLEGMPLGEAPASARSKPAEGRKAPLGEARANFHPTVKPIRLMEYLIKLITPPNGTVLDPFMGSGSTGVAAKNLNFEFIGCEMNKEYFEIAEKRIIGAKNA